MSIVALLILIALLVLFWFVWVMPQRRRQRRHVEDLMRLIELLQPGDEIITAGGLHGTVRAVADEELMVEIARRGKAGQLDGAATDEVGHTVRVVALSRRADEAGRSAG